MQKEWTSFRITLLLYILVLILPVSFYLVYSSFKSIQNDTTIVSQSSQVGGTLAYLALDTKNQNMQQILARTDISLQDISVWVNENDTSNLYIGAESLSKDFLQVSTCWDSYKKSLAAQDSDMIREHAIECREKANALAVVIEKMVYLKQHKMINLFYFALAIAMLLTLLIIYMVRLYIHKQMKKHAIHDHETKLFNKKYFDAELKTSSARAQRNNTPLSMLSISIDDFGKESRKYDQRTQEHILKIFGGLITSLTRESDVACRYDEDRFSILLPDTPEENALNLESRIREAFEKHDFGVSPELTFKFATTHLQDEESADVFIARIEALLK